MSRPATLVVLLLVIALAGACAAPRPDGGGSPRTPSTPSTPRTSPAGVAGRSSSTGSSTAPSPGDTEDTAGTGDTGDTGDTAAEPRVSGNRLVDARTGATWVPRGVDWSSFEYYCAQGRGYSALDTLGAGGAQLEARTLASWGIDAVRLPLNQDCWLGTRGAPVSDATTAATVAGYRAAVRGFVTALNAHGIVVILDLQSRKRADSPSFGNLAMPDQDSLRFWTSVAGTYRDDPSVMFDAFNEPYSRYDAANRLVFDLTWQCWRDGGCHPPVADDGMAATAQTYTAVGMTQVVAAIRAAGAAQPILLGGLDYANDLSQWLQYAPHDSQLVAAVHLYDFKPCTSSCWTSTLLPLAQHVPVLASELGADDPTGGFVSSYLAFADAHGLGALLWDWSGDPQDPMALTTDLFGHPTAYGRLAKAWLGSSGSR